METVAVACAWVGRDGNGDVRSRRNGIAVGMICPSRTWWNSTVVGTVSFDVAAVRNDDRRTVVRSAMAGVTMRLVMMRRSVVMYRTPRVAMVSGLYVRCASQNRDAGNQGCDGENSFHAVVPFKREGEVIERTRPLMSLNAGAVPKPELQRFGAFCPRGAIDVMSPRRRNDMKCDCRLAGTFGLRRICRWCQATTWGDLRFLRRRGNRRDSGGGSRSTQIAIGTRWTGRKATGGS